MSRGKSLGLAAALAVLAVATFLGWRLFYFLTDDAYIAFRYAANSLHGWGLTWNPPPFEPVEGYTSFLWVILVREVWRLTGVAPPEAANVLSLVFGYGTLLIGARLLLRMRFPEPFHRYRWLWLALALLGTVTNRTFLAWLSSGLETSMFNFMLTWWIYAVSAPSNHRGRWWVLSVSSSAVLAALTRPDGLLIVAGSVVLWIWVYFRHNPPFKTWWVQALPLLLVPAHLLWRYTTYGAWVPNTYFAKNPGFWPESGLRYVASFLVENGGWLWLIFAGLWAGRDIARCLRARRTPMLDDLVRLGVPVGILTVHAGYYLLVIGGDHFEYRVLSHLILLSFLTAPWLLAHWAPDRRYSVVGLVLFVAVSWPIPWTHWLHTRHLETRVATQTLVEPVAPHMPTWVGPWVAPYDRWQAWLIRHMVGSRHQEHKVFHQFQLQRWPSRQEGSEISWEPGHPVIALSSVGVPGWTLPEVAVLDVLGLNEPIVARQPSAREREVRWMAHDRLPPPGYFECFQPNVGLTRDHELLVLPRSRPLTDDRIRACQNAFQ